MDIISNSVKAYCTHGVFNIMNTLIILDHSKAGHVMSFVEPKIEKKKSPETKENGIPNAFSNVTPFTNSL